MNVNLNLGGIMFGFRLARPVELEPELTPFQQGNCAAADIDIEISWDWHTAPKPHSEEIGRDLLQVYYAEADRLFCMTRGGPKGFIAGCWYTPDFHRVVCTINEKPFLTTPKKLGLLLRFLPMRAIFQHFGVLFLHAAQIEQDGCGILFTAPSGTGKTTQANLWVRHENARLICNDRTLLRKEGGIWRTYGYPVDGSTPVRSGKILPLACVVLLSQAEENRAERLPSGKAIARLMPQLVMDGWSAEARTRGMELLLELLQSIPVYHLACTPDTEAVACLKHQLKKDGVIGS